MLATTAVIAATLLASVGLLPQVMKLIRTRLPDGVSPSWAALGVVTNIGWAAYLIAQTLWLAIPSVVVIVAGYAATFVLLRGLGAHDGRSIPLAAGWSAFLLSTAVLFGWGGLGTVLGFSYAVQVAPGIWVAFRTVRPDGISPGTWTIGLTEGLLWGYYGWWHADAPLMIFAVIATVASLTMLARYGATRRRSGLSGQLHARP